jgi:Domain of unknown function (DUF4349)
MVTPAPELALPAPRRSRDHHARGGDMRGSSADSGDTAGTTSTTRRRRWLALPALGAVAVVLLGACSAGSDSAGSGSAAVGRDAAGPAGAVSPAPAQNGAGVAADQGKAGTSAGTSAGGAGGGTQPQARVAPSRALIKTADLTVRVDDVGPNAARLAGIADRFGGSVYSDNRNGAGEKASADVVLKVDTGQLEEAMAAVAGLGSEERRTSTTQDVTEDVADIDSRVRTMQASIARVRAILARANSIGDVVSVEGELSRREADLESLQTRQRALAGQVAQATLTVHLLAKQAAAATPPPPGPPRHGFLGGLAAGWDAFAAFVTGLLTGVGAVLPFLLIVVPVVALLLWYRRRTRTPGTVAPPATGTTTA